MANQRVCTAIHLEPVFHQVVQVLQLPLRVALQELKELALRLVGAVLRGKGPSGLGCVGRYPLQLYVSVCSQKWHVKRGLL